MCIVIVFFWIKICRIEASNHLIIIQSKKSSFSFWSNKDSQFPFWSRNIHICTVLTTSYYQQQKTLLLLFKKKEYCHFWMFMRKIEMETIHANLLKKITSPVSTLTKASIRENPSNPNVAAIVSIRFLQFFKALSL